MHRNTGRGWLWAEASIRAATGLGGTVRHALPCPAQPSQEFTIRTLGGDVPWDPFFLYNLLRGRVPDWSPTDPSRRDLAPGRLLPVQLTLCRLLGDSVEWLLRPPRLYLSSVCPRSRGRRGRRAGSRAPERRATSKAREPRTVGGSLGLLPPGTAQGVRRQGRGRMAAGLLQEVALAPRWRWNVGLTTAGWFPGPTPPR